jgi:hypothetical protein
MEKDNIEVNLTDHTLTTIKGRRKKRKRSKKKTTIALSARTAAS